VQVERRTVAIGQRVVARAEAWFPSAAAAQEAQKTEFYVYLLTDLDRRMLNRAMAEPDPRDWWSLGAADAIRVGRVVLGNTSTNLPGARASFRMPVVPPDTYALMFCDAGCERPLANTIPLSGFTVAADPVTARLAIRLDEAEFRLYQTAVRLAETRRRAEADRTRMGARITQLASDNRRLEGRLQALESAFDPSSAKTSGWLVAGAAVGGVAAALFAAYLLLKLRKVGRPDLLGRPDDRRAPVPQLHQKFTTWKPDDDVSVTVGRGRHGDRARARG
jgi:hypothetical protein